MRAAGFGDPTVHQRFDSFLGTNKEPTARKFAVVGANFSARK